MLSEKGATEVELNKLAGAYANLLGHQNQRQKIKHMVKLKQDNLELKQVRTASCVNLSLSDVSATLKLCCKRVSPFVFTGSDQAKDTSGEAEAGPGADKV